MWSVEDTGVASAVESRGRMEYNETTGAAGTNREAGRRGVVGGRPTIAGHVGGRGQANGGAGACG